MSKRWYVHIQGPDDMEPAEGMLDAMQKAHAFNTGAVRWLEVRSDERPYAPLVWAIPIRPGDPATAHITDDETETP